MPHAYYVNICLCVCVCVCATYHRSMVPDDLMSVQSLVSPMAAYLSRSTTGAMVSAHTHIHTFMHSSTRVYAHCVPHPHLTYLQPYLTMQAQYTCTWTYMCVYMCVHMVCICVSEYMYVFVCVLRVYTGRRRAPRLAPGGGR